VHESVAPKEISSKTNMEITKKKPASTLKLWGVCGNSTKNSLVLFALKVPKKPVRYIIQLKGVHRRIQWGNNWTKIGLPRPSLGPTQNLLGSRPRILKSASTPKITYFPVKSAFAGFKEAWSPLISVDFSNLPFLTMSHWTGERNELWGDHPSLTLSKSISHAQINSRPFPVQLDCLPVRVQDHFSPRTTDLPYT